MNRTSFAGASRRLLTACAAAAVFAPFAAPPATAGLILQPRTYRLGNHPDSEIAPPGYGLRLDELFNVTSGHDRFTFSFDRADDAQIEMFLTLATAQTAGVDYTVRIHGTAFGGLVQNHAYVAGQHGLVEIDFYYEMVVAAGGDDDLVVFAPTATNTGSIILNYLGDMEIPLWDKANEDGMTLRIGDEDNDLGHRGFPGVSVWGWLNHGVPDVHYASSDFIFTVVPAPGAVALLFAGVILGPSRRRGEPC